ncbi:MAG: hypothetical protein LBH77_10630 [Tannerella sp.]|jgi:hypothetical protein|nr:hypothetical protein [Tannerella sp.]
MKQLVFTFFAIVLCYSLFFDKEPDVPAVDKLNYIYDDASHDICMSTDTLNAYARTIIHPTNRWDMFTTAADKNREEPASILIRP